MSTGETSASSLGLEIYSTQGELLDIVEDAFPELVATPEGQHAPDEYLQCLVVELQAAIEAPATRVNQRIRDLKVVLLHARNVVLEKLGPIHSLAVKSKDVPQQGTLLDYVAQILDVVVAEIPFTQPEIGHNVHCPIYQRVAAPGSARRV